MTSADAGPTPEAGRVTASSWDRPSADVWAVPGTPLLSRSAHDRAAELRTDEEYLRRAWADPQTRVLLLSPEATAQVTGGPGSPSLVFRSPAEVAEAGIRVFLGRADGRDYFAQLAGAVEPDGTTSPAAPSEPPPTPDEHWQTLREVGAALTDLDVGLLTGAVALQAWHSLHPCCPRCGARTEVVKAGWTRICPRDSSEHFPRTDPAVIMLVQDDAGRCVLARGPQWPAGRMSVLAGFVEAGESAEAAVAREVAEEVGLTIRDIRYAGSQPHPFPASLMLGFTATVEGDPTLRIDHDEIAEAGWFSRAEVRRSINAAAATDAAGWTDTAGVATQAGAGGQDGAPTLRGLPSTMSIARQLINAWLTEADG